jgi:phage-related protein
MPKTKLIFYREIDGTTPLLEWLDKQPDIIQDKCTAVIRLLADYGFELRRPNCDYLRDGIYELRTRYGSVHYRILYGYAGQNIALLSHGCTKEKEVPKSDMEQAIKNLKSFKQNPKAHTGPED